MNLGSMLGQIGPSARSFPIRVTQRRQFVTTLLVGAYSLIFNENNRLADQMEQGKLHYKDENVEINRQKDKLPYFTRKQPDYPGHIPLYNVEKLMMFLGLSLGSYFHPERNEFIVALGESSAIKPVLRRLQRKMLSDETGREILRTKPRITLDLLDLNYLRLLPVNTVGRTYIEWLDREGVSPDTRVPVRFIDDEELAYVFQRYRECHDFYHAITGLPIIIEGEISVKILEFMNLGIPMSGLGALFAPLRLKKSQQERLYNIYYPWAIKVGAYLKPLINVYWEKILERDINQVREELNIEQPPDLRNLRKAYFEKLKQEKKIV